MTITIDYYFGPQSPWTYLGHQRLGELARAAGAEIHVRPVDMGRVFAVSGGVQLKDRPKQRQAYRLVELARFRDHLKLPLNLHPKYFPVVPTMASKLIIAVQMALGDQLAFKVAGELMSAVWAQERDIADRQTLGQVLSELNLSAEYLDQAES